ncbi:MAG: SPOR domain-containing protein [Bacteroidales bacterium]|nr:SPOR domain-containing protein [Bacteroidales bacterium]
MNVAVNLLEYLKKYDNAELLGLGTFKVNYTPAFHSVVNNTITPPTRELIFVQDTNNDLGFVKYMANNEFISQETAFSWISQFTNGVLDKLDKFGTYKLGEIGVLTKQSNGQITLKTNVGLNLLEDSFAFKPLKNVKSFEKGDFIQAIITNEKPLPIEEPIQEIVQKVEIEEKKPIEEVKPEQKIIVDELESRIEEKQNPEQEVNNIIELEKSKKLDIEFISTDNKEVIEENTQESIKLHQEIKETQKKEEVEEIDNKKINSILSKIKEKKEKRRLKKAKKAKKKLIKRIWIGVFFFLLTLVLASGALIFAHYMCYLKDVKFLEPITLRLNNYIEPKCENEVVNLIEKPKVIPVETPTDSITETFENTAQEEENITAEPAKIIEEKKPEPAKKPIAKKTSKPKISGEKDAPPAPTAQIDYTTPVLIQEISRRGFDVIGGTFEQRSNAEQTARKARSMGYDSYIIQRVKNDKPIYYVSYGSRDSFGAANNFMKQISAKTGFNDLYIISR